MRLCKAFTLLFYFTSQLRGYAALLDVPIPQTNEKGRKLGPCQSCKLYIKSFMQGMEDTARGKHEGGDAAWEEEKLRSYSKSELRLVEIQEGMCEINSYKEQCHQIAEEAEDYLEAWWFTEEPRSDLYEWICIEKLQHCCPKNHFGKNCDPCVGYPDKVCNNNGKCKGEGTRKGSGLCSCDMSYTGLSCNQCNINSYEAYRDEDKLLCSPCHKSCEGSCTQGGTKGCIICKNGWIMDAESGCLDVNECLNESQCNNTEFCVNSEGSYLCLTCDKSCDGCSGDGPDMCDKCAKGYNLIDGICLDTEIENRQFKSKVTRYLTYAGMCIATCITFQKSTYLAAFVGILVATYVSVLEFTIIKFSDSERLL